MILNANFLEPYLLIGLIWAALIAPTVHWFAYRQTRFDRMRNKWREDYDYIGDDWFAVIYYIACIAHGLYWPYSIARFIVLRIKEIKQEKASRNG